MWVVAGSFFFLASRLRCYRGPATVLLVAPPEVFVRSVTGCSLS